jgi:peptidyl-prolyl cis-trans isomerase B (cyclophilin B)
MKLDPKALPSTEEIQRTVFQTFQEKRTPILVVAGLVAIAALALTWFVISSKAQEARIRAQIFAATTAPSPIIAVDQMEAVAREAAGSDSESFALLRLGLACYSASTHSQTSDEEAIGILETGLTALRDLETRFPEDEWFLAPSPENPDTPLARSLLRKMKADLAWLEEHKYTAPEVEGTLSATIETEFGNIRLGFFAQPELAPKHVENFVKLAKEGYYNGLLWHRIVRGLVIQAGCPETRDRNRYNEHGTGGPGYRQTPEPARYAVNHASGIVSTASGPEGESGSQFFICLEDAPQLDKRYTPFGKVIDGMKVVETIGKTETFGQDPAFRESEMFRNLNEHPTKDIVIRSVSIWRDGKIDDGHTWDTTIVGKPWSDPKPETPSLTPNQLAEVAGLLTESSTLEKDGKLEEAIETLKMILVIDPTHAEAIEKSAELRKKLDEDAGTATDAAAGDLMKEIDQLVTESKLREAIEKLKAILQKDSTHAAAIKKLAEIERMRDDKD